MSKEQEIIEKMKEVGFDWDAFQKALEGADHVKEQMSKLTRKKPKQSHESKVLYELLSQTLHSEDAAKCLEKLFQSREKLACKGTVSITGELPCPWTEDGTWLFKRKGAEVVTKKVTIKLQLQLPNKE